MAAEDETHTKGKLTEQKTPTPPPKGLVVTRVPYPKWWKMEQTAAISITGGGTQTVIRQRAGYRIYIATIVISVSDETEISFIFGMFGYSGAMHFGGSDEPRGMVIAMGNSPAPCGSGPFQVISSGSDAEVGGFVAYYLEPET